MTPARAYAHSELTPRHGTPPTPLHALQELGGWESAEMVRRYAHLTAEHLAPYADRLCALRVVEESADGTIKAQA
jgi:hypothetical protein